MDQKPQKPFFRKLFLINPKFQLSFIAHTLVCALAVIAIFYLANLYFFWDFSHKGQAIGLPADHIFFRFLDDQRRKLDLIFAVTAFVAFLCLTIFGIFLSHRVAGPLHHLRKHLRAMIAENSFTEVKFRKTDYFPEIADTVNEFVANYRDQQTKKHAK